MAVFTESIAGRDLVIADPAQFTTPATDLLPNGDNATLMTTSAKAKFTESGSHEFAIPWGTSDFTVEYWVRYKASPAGFLRYVLARQDATGANIDWLCAHTGATARQEFRIYAPSNSFRDGVGVDVTMDAWTHCVFTFKSSLGTGAVSGRTFQAYKNGTLDNSHDMSSSSYTPPTLSGPTFGLGEVTTNTEPVEVAKVAVYHRILTGTEVSDHYLAMTT